MTTLTLYVTPGACSFGAHVALKELGIPHHIEIVRLSLVSLPNLCSLHSKYFKL